LELSEKPISGCYGYFCALWPSTENVNTLKLYREKMRPYHGFAAQLLHLCIVATTMTGLPLRAQECSSQPVSCSFCYTNKAPILFQHPNKQGQWLSTVYCRSPYCCRARKKLSDLTLYPADPSDWKTWNDVASSVEFNDSWDAILLYKDHNFEGPCIALYLKPGTPAPDWKGWVNLSDVGFDDRASSYKLSGTGGTSPPGTRCKLVPLVLKPGQPNQLIPAVQ